MYRYSFRVNRSQIAFSNCILVWHVDQSAIFNITFKLHKESYFSMRIRTKCPGHLIGQFLYKRIYITNGTQQNRIMYRLWDTMFTLYRIGFYAGMKTISDS